MRFLRRLFFVFFFLGLAAAGLAGWWGWRELQRPWGTADDEVVFEVTPGESAGGILRRLETQGLVVDARLAKAYLVYRLGDPPLRAGEYRLEGSMDTLDVLDELIRGEVVTYALTLIEGLTLDEAAAEIARQGFGDEELLLREMRDPGRISDLDPAASTLEGYLFPETYHFARGVTEAEIVSKLAATFREHYRGEVEARVPPGMGVRDLVTLASIVEKEAQIDSERPRIAGVYSNRLERGIALYADPTVIYALKLAGTWDGNLRRPDLRFDSPYNTYVYAGLPPGPICSPGLASLQAAAEPEEHSFIYFVSRNDGTHVFAETLREHNRNVDEWQRRYWRRRWAEEN